MKFEEVLRALKAKEITPEQAKTELLRINKKSPVSLNSQTLTYTKNTPYTGQGYEKIAIIGISGQFPMAKDVKEFWNNLVQGKNCISEYPSSRWFLKDFFNKDMKDLKKTTSKRWMGCLEDYDKFDPLFFNISPLEAEYMDPQQRIFLENCWHCIEDAALKPSSLSSANCGVFVGCVTNNYSVLMQNHEPTAYSMIGINSSILSSRISYLLNLKGPSISIDTACSSSLVAIADACNNLILHTIDLAIAGGVCIVIGPGLHMMTDKMDVLSKNGICYAFDNRADGYIPGEGAGVVLLKRLGDAIRDNDNIYGIISGWGVNQDGKTIGITAPSAKSQAHLEKRIYSEFGINPETISYVETHGTGTKLGDPIEVEALKEAFRSFTKKENYCALGAVKSNIGHLMTAAGVAGVIKVLLAMQHKLLPPVINFEQLNEHIVLENSPFYINTSLKPWDIHSGDIRKAAVSAFSFSGTNAHLVLEEYIPGPAGETKPLFTGGTNSNLFVLSAKTSDQLKKYAAILKNYMENPEHPGITDILFTLQTGRDEMKYRLALITDSKESLLAGLSDYLSGKASEKIITGCVTENDEECYSDDEDNRSRMHLLIKEKNIKQIGELWVKGFTADWNILYSDYKPRRISLPAYPFAKERYWLDDRRQTTNDNSNTIHYLHPLVQTNISSLMKQCFSSVFNGAEFFLDSHRIHNQKIIPGVAYLEMARAAVEIAAEIDGNPDHFLRFKNLVLIQPAVVKENFLKVIIDVMPGENGEIFYEVYSNDENGNSIVHCQGTVEICRNNKETLIDIKSLRERKWPRVLTSEYCYKVFDDAGINYGPGHRGIEVIYAGEGEVLAKLSMPSSVKNQSGEYILHPSMMDSAFQAAVGLMTEAVGLTNETVGVMTETVGLTNEAVGLTNETAGLTNETVGLMTEAVGLTNETVGLTNETVGLTNEMDKGKPMVPFSIDEVTVMNRCVPSMWAVVRLNEGKREKNYDIDLCDEKGKICVLVKGLTVRSLDTGIPVKTDADSEISLFDILTRVQKGEMDIMSADRLLNSRSIQE